MGAWQAPSVWSERAPGRLERCRTRGGKHRHPERDLPDVPTGLLERPRPQGEWDEPGRRYRREGDRELRHQQQEVVEPDDWREENRRGNGDRERPEIAPLAWRDCGDRERRAGQDERERLCSR